jgi:secreted protein with Ig-like and vWFA domain
MKPQNPAGRARATAYALGELSDIERATFEKQMAEDPALAALASETKVFCALLDKNLALPTLELKEAAKARVLFEADKPKRDSVIIRHKWTRRITIAAACLAIGGTATWWWYPQQFESRTRFEVRQSSAPDVFGMTPNGGVSPSTDQRQSTDNFASTDRWAWDYNNNAPGARSEAAPVSPGEAARQKVLAEAAAKSPPRPPASSVQLSSAATSNVAIPDVTTSPTPPPPLVAYNEMSAPAAGGGLGGGRGTGRGSGVGDGYGPGSGPGYRRAPGESRSRDYASPASVRGFVDERMRGGVEADGERRIVTVGGEERITPGTESYKAVAENPFLKVLDARLSTFSIDVDTASYSNVRRFLNMGQCPPPQAVRLEELVNYFPYDYAPPVDGKPFAVHVEMTSAPWNENHRLARIALKGKEIPQGERPAANLVFLVDVSGSMQPENKLPLVKQSLKFVVERLTEKDTVSLVTYAGESGVALPATNGADKARIMAAIDGLGAGGSTNGAGGITTAYQQASLHFNKEGINRVILATDGDFNVGVTSHEELLKLIEEKRKTGVFLSVLGYGMGNTKDDTMELLANKGNGNYAYIDSLSEARKSLADQFSGTLVTIAKDVKIQIEFNPAVIRSYRLLGYENRMLAARDFKDDTKDAGEIGAGHTVTALYELVPVGAPEPQVVVDDLKYAPKPAAEPAPPATDVPAEFSGETMTVKLRWKAPDADVSTPMDVAVRDEGKKIAEAGPETKWAVAVAGFAAMLNGSQFNGLTWEQIRTLAKAGKGADPNGYRGEFLQLIDRAESMVRR